MRRMLQKLLVMTSTVVCHFLLFECGQAQQEERDPEGVIYKEKRVPSVIGAGQEDPFLPAPTLLAPTIVRANEDFKIEFYTIGGGCVRKGGEDALVVKNVATVKAYDLASGQRNCNFALQYLTHTVTLRFTKPGKATIKILGIREGSDARLRRRVRTVLEHHLTVTGVKVGAGEWRLKPTPARAHYVVGTRYSSLEPSVRMMSVVANSTTRNNRRSSFGGCSLAMVVHWRKNKGEPASIQISS
jgi:hypothetical protein